MFKKDTEINRWVKIEKTIPKYGNSQKYALIPGFFASFIRSEQPFYAQLSDYLVNQDII